MNKGWMDLLTEEAATEDAEKWINSLGKLFREMYYHFAEPISMKAPSSPLDLIEKTEPKEFFQRILSIFNLYPDNKYNSCSKYSMINDSIAIMALYLKQMYSYARGETIKNNKSDISRLIDHYCIVTRALALLYYDNLELDSDKIFENLISPRFVYARKVFKARSDIESAYNLSISSLDTKGIGVSPAHVALLGDVVYNYIIKLIKTNKLRAWKVDNTRYWEVDINDALKWLLNRPNCPDWLKDLLVQNSDRRS